LPWNSFRGRTPSALRISQNSRFSEETRKSRQ
jgi:hypothetical protein